MGLTFRRSVRRNTYWSYNVKNDPIIAEIRKYRDAYAARFNYDVYAMFKDMKKRERESGHKVVNLARRRKPKSVTAKAA